MWHDEYTPPDEAQDEVKELVQQVAPLTPDEALGAIIGQLTTHVARLIGEREALRERVRHLEGRLAQMEGGR